MNRKLLIVGGGIAGLCAGVYARLCGYDALVLEMGASAGGLATSWKRGDYTFETCLHWLMGCNPSRPFYSLWREVFDIGKLSFVYPMEFLRLETEHVSRCASLPIQGGCGRSCSRRRPRMRGRSSDGPATSSGSAASRCPTTRHPACGAPATVYGWFLVSRPCGAGRR